MSILESLREGILICNIVSTLFLILGFIAIKKGQKTWHKRFMGTAFISAFLLLVVYLIYTSLVGHLKYNGQTGTKVIFLIILGTHTLLAIATPFLAVTTVYRALKGQFERHKKIARITFPIWMYVSVTGIVIYFMTVPG